MEFQKSQTPARCGWSVRGIEPGDRHGALKPRERLNIYELVSVGGVKLTPVRSVIQELAMEGLVEIRPRSGTFVANLTLCDVEENFKIRCPLECLAAEDAIRYISPQQIQRARELFDALREPVHNEDKRKTHERNNSERQQIIMQASGNERLWEMYHAPNAQIQIEEEGSENDAIVSARKAHDGAALTAALRKHIYGTKQVMTSALVSLGSAGLGHGTAPPLSSYPGRAADTASLKSL